MNTRTTCQQRMKTQEEGTETDMIPAGPDLREFEGKGFHTRLNSERL